MVSIQLNLFLVANTQTLFHSVRAILDTKCSQSCHNSTNLTGNLNLTGTDNQIRNALVNVAPSNLLAAQKGNKLVKPGYPEQSFLLRKCAITGWDNRISLDNLNEGTKMPSNYPADSLSKAELETIRQWILYGAKTSGNQVSQTTITDFYGGLGLPLLVAPSPPVATEGFQIHLGPFLREPNTEIEYFLKHDLNLPDSLEVNRIEVFMNKQSHHFIMYKFLPGQAGGFPDGLRTPNQNNSNSATSMISGWQFNQDVRLPQNTAYFWEKETVLDLNYHLLNTNSDSVLGAEVYMNIYTQPKNSGAIEMHCELVLYGNNFPYALSVPVGEVTRSQSDYVAGSTDTMFVWRLTSHTHKYGVDYDLYLRNPNGTKGEQIYEGFYDVSYSFNQNFYDWHHPAVRLFDPMLPVKESEGLIQEAKYNNTGSSSVGFGLTTSDEMMLYQIQYTQKEPKNPSGIGSGNIPKNLKLFPNPSTGEFAIQFPHNMGKGFYFSIQDMTGKQIFEEYLNLTINSEYHFNGNLEPGLYYISIKNSDIFQAAKLAVK